MQGKGKRKIVESGEAEKSYMFKEDSLVERVALEIEEKRQHCNRRGAERNRVNQILEEIERRL